MNEAPLTELQIEDCWNRIGIWRTGDTRCERLDEVIHCRNCEVYSQAGRAILKRPLPEEARDDWTRIYAETKQVEQAADETALVFRLGDEWLGLPNAVVHEVTSARPIQRLPHTSSRVMKGLVNMRGELQICVSLGGVLGLDKGESPIRFGSVGISDRMIHIERDGQRYVFPVTEVHGLVRFRAEQLGQPPATVSHARNNYIRGVLSHGEHNVGMIDDELLFYTLGRNLK